MDTPFTGRPALSSIPPDILCAQDYETLAASFLPSATHAYIAGGSGLDMTAAANRSGFDRWSILPRLLCDVSGGHTRFALAGTGFAHPVLLAPVAHQKLVHPLAELASAQAAAATDSTMVCSTLSSRSMEEIAAVANGRRWFQLYLQPQRASTLELLRRAEASGYQAIVLTLDASIQAPSLHALRSGFRMPADCHAVNLATFPVEESPALGENDSRLFQGMMRTAPRWEDLDWLLQQTALPVWVKGVLHPDDALELKKRKIAGIVVSNHGGRSLDGAPASLHMLPLVRAAVGAGFPLLLDSGIRSGADIFKALALGADAVMVGRLQLYALGVAGALGVAHMLKMLREELELTMAMAGCASLADIDRASLVANFVEPSL